MIGPPKGWKISGYVSSSSSLCPLLLGTPSGFHRSGTGAASLRAKSAEMEVERFQKHNANDKGKLGGGFKYFLCSSLFWEMVQFD